MFTVSVREKHFGYDRCQDRNILNAGKIRDKCLKFKTPVSSRRNRINCNIYKKSIYIATSFKMH